MFNMAFPARVINLGGPYVCDCEYAHHFDDATGIGAHHEYGAEYPRATRRRTCYGSFLLCDDCIADGHYEEEDREVRREEAAEYTR